MMLDKYEQKLLQAWEDVHKQGQLTLWIMLALKDGPKHMAEIREFILRATNSRISADDKSLYRALRRYHDSELVEFSEQASPSGGPDRKIYSLSVIGNKVLSEFLQKNVIEVFYNADNRKLIERSM
jgi:PadR family transcriptional regulator, regulatory protein PadR